MKKIIALLLVLAVCLSLCACDGSGTANVSAEDLYGVWHNEEHEQVL